MKIKELTEKLKMKEVLVTTNAELYGMLLHELKNNDIHCKTKSVHGGTQNRYTGSWMGRLGENVKQQTVYYIYVSKEDEGRAHHIFRGISR